MTDQERHRVDPYEWALTVDEWRVGHDRADATDVEVVQFHQVRPALLIA